MPDSSNFKGRKLYRSQVNRMLGGVCGGLAEYFNIDEKKLIEYFMDSFARSHLKGHI